MNVVLNPASNWHITFVAHSCKKAEAALNSGLLFVLRATTDIRTRAFSVAAPTEWNSLPVSVKSV